MTASEHDLPEFLREALEEPAETLDLGDATGLREALRLHELFAAEPPDVASLMASVEDLSLRYAPMFDRIATLWDVDVAQVEQVMELAKEPASWRKPGLPGLQVIDVQGGEKVQGADLHLVRFKAGMRFPMHRHPGPEALLVLEGNYKDSSGRVVMPGDLHVMEPGTEHAFVIGKKEPCIAASMQAGREFTGFWMKILIRLFG